MKLTEFFREELDREVERSRKALEQVPDGKYQWKPHDKSMIFGYLADMVATIPTWITMEINRDELETTGARTSGVGRNTHRDDPGHHQSLGASPGTDDCVPAFDGSKGPRTVWTVRRRAGFLEHGLHGSKSGFLSASSAVVIREEI